MMMNHECCAANHKFLKNVTGARSLPPIDWPGWNKRGSATELIESRKMAIGCWLARIMLDNQENCGKYFLVFLVSIGWQIPKLEVLPLRICWTIFINEIRDIRESTGASPPTSQLPSASVFLDNFKPYTTKEVRKMILSTKSTSCSLDLIPTYVVKEFLTDLLPYITDYRSLQFGWLPLSQRHAIVKPILKKEGLDQDDEKNYRPISNLTYVYVSKLVERIVSN